MRHSRASRGASLLLGALGAVALLGLPLPEEHRWGFLYPSLLPLPLRLIAGVALAAVLLPPANRLLRRIGSSVLDRVAGARPGVATAGLLATAALLFVAFQSRRLYGDATATIALIEGGQLINWKEPLDRLGTALTYRLGRPLFGWDVASAVAAVSTVAGLGWVYTSMGFARSVATTRGDRAIVVALLLTCGLMQLFFGNVENYSLLATGILVYIWMGIRYLQGETRLLAPSLALGVTCWIHLAAAWLLPSLAVLFVFGHVRSPAVSPAPSWPQFRAGAAQMALGLGLPTVLTVTLALGLRTEGAPTPATFGGGDGRMFVPLSSPSGPFEKYTLFGVDHLAAMANEVILVCGAAAVLLAAYLALTPRRHRRTTPAVWFMATAAILLSAFSFLFNADMAVFDVGVRNEWDLLSPPAVAIVPLASLVLLDWERDPESRSYVALVAIAVSLVLTGSWIAYNARTFE